VIFVVFVGWVFELRGGGSGFNMKQKWAVWRQAILAARGVDWYKRGARNAASFLYELGWS